MRARYESVLLRNPFQERAFNSVYEGYAKVEGVDQWIEALMPKSKEGEDQLASLLVLGQIYDRQFKTAEAMAVFEQAAVKGEARPQFKVLLGTLYYKAGKDEAAAKLLSESLDTLTDLDQRASVSRLLGNLYLRQGKRDEAVTVWKRIAEQNPEEIFAQLELAEIYEDNRMWDQAIAVYRGVADRSKDDPYRRCRALRSIGQCFVQAEKFKEAIATYEQALELVAPGNWLFEDLKLRLVGVYEDIGDLAGLVKYVEARLQQNPGDIDFRDLLAETLTRMAKFDAAELQYRQMIERNPRNSSIYEKLIALHQRTGKKAEVTVAFEKLLELFPTDSEYLRRLGEFYLRDSQPDKAKETWRRLVKDEAGAEKFATLAGWFESYEFVDEAIATYRQALDKKKEKDWTERLAALKFQKGEEQEAVQLWLSLITDQSKPEEYAEVASILESNNKHDEALVLRKRAVEQAPDNLEGRLAYAKVLMKKQLFETAAAEFELLAAQDKNEFLMQQGEQGRAEAWRELGILEEKQKQLENEVTANPADARKLGQLARLYERAGQREKAIALYEGRREKEPDNLEHLRALATLYRTAKQTEQAIAAFKTLLDKDKVRARVYQKELLDIYLAVDLKDEAMAAGEALVSLAPGDPEVHLMLAQVYQIYRHLEKAFGEYRAALRLEANEPDYHRQYGEALEQEKRHGDAQESFRKMLDVAKEDSTRLAAVSALARIHLHQDRLAELVTEFQRRIRNTPKKLAAYEELAAIYKESGQIARSVEILESGLNTVDDKSAALKSLIRVAFEAQDFPKVKSYFEQLVTASGKPTSNEFEKLGQIYTQLGDLEKARQTWSRIVTESPKDPKAHDRLAQILRDAGFVDEALAMKARAVELDAADYKRRFEYAQLLAQNEQPVEALKQLNQILDLGMAEQAKEEKQPEKKVKPVQRGAQGAGSVSAYQFAYGMRNYGGGYYGGGWQGSFRQFRPQLLMFMANVAQQSIGEDAFIEQFQERAKKSKGSADAQRDLLTILQMYNRVEDALKVALELLERVPNDVDLLQQTALYYQNQQQLDQAIPLLERLAQAQPKHRLQALQGLVPLYFQNKQEDKALELADQLLKENPSDTSTIYAMGSFLQRNGKLDRARAIYTRAMDIDPRMKPNLLMNIAQIALQENKPDEARQLFTELLTADFGSTRYAWMGPRRQMNLYIPQAAMGPGGMSIAGRYGLVGPGRMPPNVFGNIDYTKQNAVQQLKMLSKRDGPGAVTNDFTAELEKTARSYKTAISASDRNKAWDTAKLLCSYYIGDKQLDKALDLLKTLREAGYEEMEWFNIAIYLAEQEEEYDKMAAFYDEVQQRFPAKSRDVAQAKAMTFVKAKKYDDTAKVVREMNQQRVPPAQILNMIMALRAAGEKKTARALLEEHLAGVSRNSDALQQLAQLYGEENEFEKAIELASEAWERKAHGRSSQGYMYGPRVYYGGYPGGGQDSLLGDLHRYHVAQGKSEELVNQFKQRLEKQPSSVQAHENLAQLYRMSNDRQAALELYRQLAEKRPHLHQIRRQIAQLFTEMGDTKKATQYYEDLMKANPMAYEQFQWELRWLYQRMGKGRELAQMEQKVIDKARDPNQIRQVAERLNQDGEYDKADLEAPKNVHREIFEKKKDQNSFHSCLSFLQNQGFDRAAHEFFLANKEGGYLEQYRGQEVFALCFNESDYETPLDLNWQFTRYGERWSRDQFFSQIAKLFSDRGKFPMLLADSQARITAETNRNQLLQQKLAEAWARGGQPEKAKVIYDEMIVASPFNRAAIAAKAQLLVKLGRDDEALALLRELKGVQTLQDEIDAKFQLIELLARLGRTAESEKELEALLAWAKGGPALERAANAYRDMQKWAKAAELYEQSRKVLRNWNYSQLLFNLGRCYAKLGRQEDALKTWESRSSSPYYGGGFDDDQLTTWILGEGLNELALKFARARLEKNPENIGAYVTLARAQLGLGKTNESFAAFDRGAQALKPEQHGDLRNRLGQFITEYSLESAVLAQGDRLRQPLVAGALINVLAGADEKSERAKLLGANLDKFSTEDAELQLALGGAFLKSKRHPEAAVQFRKALASTNETQRVAAARSLAEAGFAAEAAPTLANLLNTRPHAFVSDIALVTGVARTRDTALIAKLTETLAASALHESQNEFYATVITYHRGQTNEARAKLATLAAAPKLTAAQLQTLAGLCADQGLAAERAACLQRLASGGHAAHTRNWALSELVKTSAQAGDFKQAVQGLSAMPASWGTESGAEAREAVAEAVTSDNFAAFKAAVLATVHDKSGSDLASNLIGLCAQIAQRVGQSESAASLAAESKINHLEREEAAAWDDLIEQWDVAGPFRGQAPEPTPPVEYNQFGQPIVRTPPRAPEPALAPTLAWKKTDPRRELGTIRLTLLLGVNTSESGGQFAYARTTITSPEDRVATFALGSDDSVTVWVNGEQVNVSSEARSLHPDQDRFNVRLKKGENRVLLKIGNVTDAWGFCLRVLSGREGLSLAQRFAP